MWWIWIFLGIITGIVLLVRIIGAEKSVPKESDVPADIKNGRISLLFDSKSNATVIPFAKDEYGRGRASSMPLRLFYPYNPYALGKIVLKAMSLSDSRKTVSGRELMESLESPSWKDYSRGKRNISIYYKEDLGIVLNSTLRKADGSYIFNVKGIEETITDISDIEGIGSKVLDVLKRCR